MDDPFDNIVAPLVEEQRNADYRLGLHDGMSLTLRFLIGNRHKLIGAQVGDDEIQKMCAPQEHVTTEVREWALDALARLEEQL